MNLTDELKRIFLRIETAVSSATPSGTNTIGKLAANSGVDIGDVDVTSVSIPASLVYGQTTVASAGTDVTLGGSAALVIGITVKALSTNGGLIYVGLEGVSASTGYELAAGEQVFIPVANRATVWIDTSNGGDAVSFIGN